MVGRFFHRKEAAETAIKHPADGEDKAPLLVEPLADVAASQQKPAKASEKAMLPDFVAIRVDLHRYLLDKINLGILDTMEENALRTLEQEAERKISSEEKVQADTEKKRADVKKATHKGKIREPEEKNEDRAS